MKQIGVEELKRLQLDILSYFDEFCKNNSIRYWIDYGTLLGAIRHKGFIPWDDDIDITMLRNDYNRAAELFNKQKLNYITFYLKYLFKKTNNVIYNIIGVLPEYQKTGLAIALIHKSIKMRQEKYPNGVSSFILEDNIPSTMLCRKLSVGINKEFHLYEIPGDKNV